MPRYRYVWKNSSERQKPFSHIWEVVQSSGVYISCVYCSILVSIHNGNVTREIPAWSLQIADSHPTNASCENISPIKSSKGKNKKRPLTCARACLRARNFTQQCICLPVCVIDWGFRGLFKKRRPLTPLTSSSSAPPRPGVSQSPSVFKEISHTLNHAHPAYCGVTPKVCQRGFMVALNSSGPPGEQRARSGSRCAWAPPPASH